MVLSLDRWFGKVAVVTGASVGIGALISEKLVEAGIIVAGLARRTQPIEELSAKLKGKKGKLHAIKCDVTKESDIKKAFWEVKKIGPIHILINNAGLVQKTTLYNGDPEKWKNILEVNVLGTCMVTKEAIKDMTENKVAGQIINMNSVLGHFVYNIPEANVYPASKHAITALTEALRLELLDIDSSIKVTSVSPGPVSGTEFFSQDNLQVQVKGFLKPENITDTVMFVLSTPPDMLVADVILRPLKEPY
ncbi:farnesol dehydrogenase-like [Cylas formicarius]|uniref:farnesol dehydrogenase-like n=1 Tax=Cylas formicarius TaxID=197179 RepID=UPI0029587280|nr:farnesol dehydrogenase-like [Cylas formicarius]